MFSLTATEFSALMSQTATSKGRRGGRRKLPLAFTEHGALMAATVLNSPRARDVAVYVVRAFVRLRDLLASNKELAQQLMELERRLEDKLQHQDRTIARILDAIHRLMNPPEPKKRQIGFAEPEGRGDSDWLPIPGHQPGGSLAKADLARRCAGGGDRPRRTADSEPRIGRRKKLVVSRSQGERCSKESGTGRRSTKKPF